jgi:hypothetical protein
MSIPSTPLPARSFLSVLGVHWEEFWDDLRPRLEALLGEIDYESDLIPFTQTSYYDQEMGRPITRRILSFSLPLTMDDLPRIKVATNALENEYARDGRRRFNLDPGYITQERLVLATGKNFSHRIYLEQGIWADLTLIFHKGDWFDLPWTFPDYAGAEIKAHLTRIREMYKHDLKHIRDTSCPKV